MNESTVKLLRMLVGQPKGSQRSSSLLHGFEDGYTHGWFFEIDEVFRASLDLVSDGKGGHSQGSMFAFKEGEILYSSPKGYLPGRMADMCLQVRESRGAAPKDAGAARDAGLICFTVYTYQAGLQERLSKRMTQDAFVEFLIAGPTMAGWEDVASVAKDVGMSWRLDPM